LPAGDLSSVAARLLDRGLTLIDESPASALEIIDAALLAQPARETAAKALSAKAFTLGALGRNEDAIAVYDELLARFGSASELPLREQVAKGLRNKGFRLGALGRSEDEIAVYDDLLARFGNASEMPLREQVANGLFNKGFRLGALGRSEDAMAVYDDLLVRFGSSDEPALITTVDRAKDALKALASKGGGPGDGA
jgi:tetratricopeptide (TPR) repeat protein